MKRYSLQKKSYINVISDNFSETLKDFGGFAGCLAGAGITWGIIRNMDMAGKLSSTAEINMVPGVFIICAVFFAKQMYNSFKEERERVHQLALEIDKERARRKAKKESQFITEEQAFRLETQKLFDKNEKVVELQKYLDILNDGNVQDNSGATQDKRKSLNNGIFKSNDTY